MLWPNFKEIFELTSLPEGLPLFNPYRDSDPGLDRPGAPEIRRQNLRGYLEALGDPPRILLVGEAPGWRGCRFSGVPFTSEAQLAGDALPFNGEPTSLAERPYSEASATIFWRVMEPYFPDFLVWNCVPYHPHPPGEPLKNRRPTRVEMRACLPGLRHLVEATAPTTILAVGRSAQFSLSEAGIHSTYIRHPSHGGASAFEKAVTAVFHSSPI